MFLQALLAGEEMPVSSMEGCKTVVACRAAIESAENGMPVKFQYPEF